MTIDWQCLRRKEEAGLLTADEAEALVRLAQRGWIYTVDEYDTMCNFCGNHVKEHPDYPPKPHDPDCPIAVLEAASDGEANDDQY